MDLNITKFDMSSMKDDKVIVLIGKRETGKSVLVKDLLATVLGTVTAGVSTFAFTAGVSIFTSGVSIFTSGFFLNIFATALVAFTAPFAIPPPIIVSAASVPIFPAN